MMELKVLIYGVIRSHFLEDNSTQCILLQDLHMYLNTFGTLQ